MAKVKSIYQCQECGATSSQWVGQCLGCQAWNTLVESVQVPEPAKGRPGGYAGAIPERSKLSAIKPERLSRLGSGYSEFDRVLGGGFVPGSVILLGGAPGAGKSTLLLQVTTLLSAQKPCLYVTGEESLEQIALRAKRLGLSGEHLECVSETRVEAIAAMVEQVKPALVVADSVQVMQVESLSGAPGSVGQVRESAAQLTRLAKATGVIVLLVGHVTKEGALAGPKVLEHIIDASLLLEGDSGGRFRTLRAHKNRFGSVGELGVFAMTETGLREVKNPSAIFLSRPENVAPGSSVICTWEGTRPLLVEVQALVDSSLGGSPKRVAVGLDGQRLAMLLAILHRHGHVQLGDQDVFVNAVGGVKVTETGADLGLLLACVSSFRGKTISKDWVIFGEVGLSGEVRPVASGQERIREAAKHGFQRAIVPSANAPKQPVSGIEVCRVERISQVLELFDES
ncbi:MAG: DNA repair protein RadA [Gammaproteobacteria bacterium]|nr:DNA repair protein RadA [Gammaproteobacteria bacterium]